MSNSDFNKTGEVSWSDTSSGSGERKNSKDTFLKLNPGSNVVRLISQPYQYYHHKYMAEGGRKWGYKVGCAGKGCPLCATGDKSKRRWFVAVIERKTGMTKILDIGWTVFKAISTLNNDVSWGNPLQYDLDIVVDPNGGATSYYSVVPKPPKPPSASDIAARDAFNFEDMNSRVQPLTPEKVQERLDRIAAEISGANGSGQTQSYSNKSSNNDDDEEEGDFFKSYDNVKGNHQGHARS